MTSKYLSLLERQIQIIPNRLSFLATSKKIKYESSSIFEFNVDDALKYQPFHQDFGPLKISCVFQYVEQLMQIDRAPQNKRKKFMHITSTDPKKYTNSIFLICCYLMIGLKKTPDEAYEPFKNFKIIGFRDSSSSDCVFQLQIIDCLKGLYRAMRFGWFSMDKFSIDSYQYYELTQNGDINEIIKDQIYAFSAPSEQIRDRLGKKNLTNQDLSKILKELGVELVVHLQNSNQFPKALQNQKIASCSLPFAELTVPDHQIIQKFFAILQKNEKMKIAINCKTGLGKVGTLIACYLIKKFSFSASQSIAWIRLCRPGSVIGHQQQFLVSFQKKIYPEGRLNQIGQSVQKKSKLIRRYSHNHNEQPSIQQSKQLNVTIEKLKLNKLNSLKGQVEQPQFYSPTIKKKSVKANNNPGFNIQDFLNQLRSK